MALTIELSVAIANDRETFTVSDLTTYGGDNPARSAVGVFLSASKMNYDNTVANILSVTSDDDDEETDSSWEIEYTTDGWYRMYFVVVPDFDNTLTYARYAAVFNPTDNKVYRSKQNNNTENSLTNTTWFEEITDPASLAANKGLSNESTNVSSTVYNRVLSADSQYTFANQLSNQSKFVDDDESDTLQEYNIFAQWLDAVAVADSRTEVLDGEELCRRIQSRYKIS
jgi:hypothetical protein